MKLALVLVLIAFGAFVGGRMFGSVRSGQILSRGRPKYERAIAPGVFWTFVSLDGLALLAVSFAAIVFAFF